jgi:hypothetical protein
MGIGPIVDDAVEFPSTRQRRSRTSLGVVCLILAIGIAVTVLVCFLGFNNEIAATIGNDMALSNDVTGSIPIQELPTTADVKNLSVQRGGSHH